MAHHWLQKQSNQFWESAHHWCYTYKNSIQSMHRMLTRDDGESNSATDQPNEYLQRMICPGLGRMIHIHLGKWKKNFSRNNFSLQCRTIRISFQYFPIYFHFH